MGTQDQTLEFLLDLDGYCHPVGKELSGYIVQFSVKRVAETKERPHGIKYSMVLRAPNGQRIAAFDNAHRADDTPKDDPRLDHKHRFQRISAYDFRNAQTLIEDFYKLVDSVLKEENAT